MGFNYLIMIDLVKTPLSEVIWTKYIPFVKPETSIFTWPPGWLNCLTTLPKALNILTAPPLLSATTFKTSVAGFGKRDIVFWFEEN